MISGENISFAKVEKRKLVDQVLAQLQRIIQSNQYVVGDKIPTEIELMKLLDVGRSTVREAIRILAHAGILEVRQGHGTFIRSKHVEQTLETNNQKKTFREIFEVRRILEIPMIGLAAERRTEEDLKTIKKHLFSRNKHLEEGKYTEYIKSDIKFHLAICEASHNLTLINMYSNLIESLNQMFNVSIIDVDSYKDNTIYHEKLYLAILNQNVEDAKNWAEINLSEVKSKYKDV